MDELQTVALHPLAPHKVAQGERCNGCGLCCASEPCPMACLLLFQFKGSCRALVWQEDAGRYVCGLVTAPDRFVALIPRSLRQVAGKLIARRIASGSGCDCSFEVLDD